MQKSVSLSEQIHALSMGLKVGSPDTHAYNELLKLSTELRDELKDEANKRKNYAYKVAAMRKKQIEYFAAAKEKNWIKAGPLKKEAKLLESDVDQKTIEIIQGVEQAKLL